jgi:hypothetical protein
MNKKLIGGIVLLGGISVIAYYFLFSKKSEKDLLKKFEEKKKNEDELAKIDVDLSIGLKPVEEDAVTKLIKSEGLVPTLPDTNPFAPSFTNLSPKEISDIKTITDSIYAPVVNINPIDFSQLDFGLMGSDSFQQYVNNLYEQGNIKSGKTPALPTW